MSWSTILAMVNAIRKFLQERSAKVGESEADAAIRNKLRRLLDRLRRKASKEWPLRTNHCGVSLMVAYANATPACSTRSIAWRLKIAISSLTQNYPITSEEHADVKARIELRCKTILQTATTGVRSPINTCMRSMRLDRAFIDEIYITLDHHGELTDNPNVFGQIILRLNAIFRGPVDFETLCRRAEAEVDELIDFKARVELIGTRQIPMNDMIPVMLSRRALAIYVARVLGHRELVAHDLNACLAAVIVREAKLTHQEAFRCVEAGCDAARAQLGVVLASAERLMAAKRIRTQGWDRFAAVMDRPLVLACCTDAFVDALLTAVRRHLLGDLPPMNGPRGQAA